MGVTLGLLGGGGSLLTVPILIYLFGMGAVEATGYSLMIVGASALVGCISYGRQGLIDYAVGFKFGIPSIVSVYIVRKFVVPALPEKINAGFFLLKLDDLIIGIFVIFALIGAWLMIKANKTIETDTSTKNYLFWIMEGVIVGSITGFVGAGGGFLIIPALVIMAGMDIKKAIPTSLLIIAMKSLIGGIADLTERHMDFGLLGTILLVSGAGMLLGTLLAKKSPTTLLKKLFGWLMLAVSFGIIYKQWLA